MTRRTFVGALGAPPMLQGQDGGTRFQMACMTLPYAPFPFARALAGIRAAGFQHVAWGTTHPGEAGPRTPLLDVKAGAGKARELAKQSKDAGLTPVMMFSTVMLEAADAVDGHLRRIEQAAEAGIPYLLTFGKTAAGEYEKAIACLKAVGPKATAAGVIVVIKQHGGNTATGKDCSRIIAEVGDDGVRMCYDAGNVLDYENHDPIPDLQECWQDVRAFAMKDHRNWPKDEDCGPGFGEIDHYRLLATVMRTGRIMPMAFENIFEPLKPRPQKAEEVDALARRSREYVESVIAGLRVGAR
ncbi:MAG: TIM barrel protein [Acidobacteriota bacterium]